tara:strand:+ start:98 stop:1324 length:1227 start_codon:yes stop_codon:yes gene_type:complete
MIYTGFTPHSKQQEMIHGILNSTAKYHVACVGRQFGKSLMGINLALYWAINNNNVKVLWVSPVYAQASKVQKEIIQAISQSGIVKSANYSSNEIVLKNGSEIIFRSAERYDNIRGMTCDYGIIDEAAFCKDESWTEAIKPVFLVKGKKVLFISTPKGSNWFKNLFQLGKSYDNVNYEAYTGSSYDTPYIDKSEIEDAKKTLPENVFKQEYLAEFIDSGGEVFANIDKNLFTGWSQPVGKVYCGIDLGKQEDFTVATFIDSTGKIIDIYRDNQTEWSTMTAEILKRLKRWNATAMVEVNSIGDVIYEQIKKQWQDTHPFITSSKSKNEIIEGLILDMNEITIKIPNSELFPALYSELSVFTYTYNPKTRNIKYGHPSGLHDDTVMSLAIANYNRKQNKSVGSYATMSKR